MVLDIYVSYYGECPHLRKLVKEIKAIESVVARKDRYSHSGIHLELQVNAYDEVIPILNILQKYNNFIKTSLNVYENNLVHLYISEETLYDGLADQVD